MDALKGAARAWMRVLMGLNNERGNAADSEVRTTGRSADGTFMVDEGNWI